MDKELEEAIKYLKLIRKNHDLEKKGYVYTEECIDTVLNYIENSIPKKKLEEFIEQNAHTDTYNFKTIEVSKLKELLEDK